MEVPYNLISEEALKRIIESYVLREGTDYGRFEYSLEQKVTQVFEELKKGDAVIVYDDKSESCNIIPKSKS